MACHPKLAPSSAVISTSGAVAMTDEEGNPQLLGINSRTALEQTPYDRWFVKNYSDYTVDSATADRLRAKLAGAKGKGGNAHPGKGIQLRIFMGTWCGDSQREVPRMLKILDYCGIDPSAVQLVMVSEADSTYKQSPGHEERGLNIFRVPDLIVLEEGKERGRIVESPVRSLEKDLLAIVDGDPYTPHYEGAALLINAFREEKMNQLEKELPELAARVKPLVHSPSELKSYAHVLRVSGKAEKADLTLRINALIFPAGK